MIHFLLIMLCLFHDSFSRLKIPNTTISVDESSCVVVPCFFKPMNKIQSQENHQRIIWFKDAIYNNEKKDFEGTIVFSDIISSVDPEFARRVEYLGDLNFIRKAETFTPCDVKLSDLRKEDTGKYSFRYYVGSTYKWMSDGVLLTVKENPCSISLEGNPVSHEGKNISLTCRTKGSCNKGLQWQYPPDGIQNPTEVEQGSKVRYLTFTPTWKSHQKTLSCQIQGSKDECAARSITLNITFAPQVVRVKTDKPISEIIEDSRVTLVCEVEAANPNVTIYHWYTDGVLRKNDTFSTIVFQNISRHDSGEYYCIAFNQVGNGTSEAFSLDVLYKPKNTSIKESPDLPKELTEGVDVKMVCLFETGNPSTVTITWYKNDKVISGKDSNLNINNITYTNNEDKYKCEVKNAVGMDVSDIVQLRVLYPPKETTATINPESVNEGNKVTLSCSSKGNPEILTYTWFKEGTGIIGSVNKYTFKKIQIADKGRYFCQAKNALGIANSSVVVIDVKYAPKNVTIVMNPSNDMIEGTSVNLTCTIDSSNPFKCEFAWYRGEVFIRAGKTLFFRSIEYTNAGFYSCVVSNSVGTGKSNTTHVNVLHGPKETAIKMSVPNGTVKVNQSMILTCVSRANPQPKYYWYRKESGSPVMLQNTYHELQWKHISPDDAGEYHCCVENFLNAVNSTSVTVEVLYPPITPNLTLQSDVIEGYQMTIYCSVQSHPPSVLSLVPSKHRATTSSNSITVAFHVSFEDTGKYVCIAQNSEGKSKAEEYLKVKYAPKSTSLVVYPSTEIRENQEGRISCKTQAHPPVTEYSWFKITDHKEHRVGKGAELNFKEISFMDSGKYFCRVKNDIGENKSAVTELKVWYAPKNTTVVYNLSGQKTPKGMIWLMCSSKGYPPVNRYRWYKVNDRKVETFVSHDQNITVTNAERVSYYCIAYNDVSNQQSSLQALPIYYGPSQMILIFILVFSVCLLILIVVCFVFRQQKRRGTQGSEADDVCFNLLRYMSSQNDTQETLMLEGAGDSHRSREDLVGGIHNPHGPQSGATLQLIPCSGSTVYSTLKQPDVVLVDRGQRKRPTDPTGKGGSEDTDTETLKYAALAFQRNPETSERTATDVSKKESGDPVYAKVNKPGVEKESSGKTDYENLKGTLSNQKDKSEENESEEIHYSSVFAVQPSLGRTLEWESEPDSEEEEYITRYSDVKP
ncbi:B-cell receptor CD22 [Lepisosteus oculatus]|uniref:B-cell receptor CD22 n=1 Tax=Lepisosteus oculatus TaxID=7918 RepID=UPI00371C0FDC